jgi:hypothetical protein
VVLYGSHVAGILAGYIDNMYVTLTNAFRSQYMSHHCCRICTCVAKLHSVLLGKVTVDMTEVNFAKGG